MDDLVADAAGVGHQITIRLIRDWTQAGLLDRPRKRPAGRGRGSSQALYAEHQRKLLLTLLSKRPGNGISGLARIPVGIWMYWGDDYVPVRQVRRAMLTWIGDPGVSLRQAKETARAILGQLDNPKATPASRRALLKLLTEIGHTGHLDADRLEAAVFDVFEPGSLKIRRAVGHPAAPLMVESVVEVMKARLTGMTHLRHDKVSDEAFYQARHAHLMAYAEYAVKQPAFAGTAPTQSLDMYEPVTAEKALNDCCVHLLTTIGLEIMYPDRAAQLRTTAGPASVRAVSPAARRAILKVL